MIPPFPLTLQPFIFQLLLITVSFFLFFFFFVLNKINRLKTCKLPPSPLKLPLIGNLHQLGSLPHRSLHALSQKHGPLMFLRLGRVPTIVVSSANVAREVMKTHDLAFASRPKSMIADTLFYGSKDIAFSPFGDYWRQVRRISVLHLLSLKMVQSFRLVRAEEVAVLVEKIRASPGAPINLSEMINVLTNDLFCRVAFGRKYSDSDGGANRIRELFAEFVTLLAAVHIGDFFPGFSWVDSLRGLNARGKRNFRDLDAIVDKVIEDHLVRAGKASSDQGTSPDFVDVLLSLDTNTDGGGGILTRNDIKALILDMFTGGTDTTFTALEWIMAEIVSHPEAMKALQQEVRGVVGEKEVFTEEDIEQMKYLKAVIKESLRLHPPVPLLVPHESTVDVQLCGYDIPAGTRVIVNAWAIGRDPGSWERAEEFLPERFIDSSMDFRGHDFELIPFGAGRRGCPGIGFAVSAIELTLANLVLRFNWALPGGAKAEDLDMAEKFGITTHKKYNLILVAKSPL